LTKNGEREGNRKRDARSIDEINPERERERDEIDPNLFEIMVMSRKAGSLMRCERTDPKKGKNMASERDGGSHRRRENHDRARRGWLMREWWHAEAR
jgi:hypothetical protein